MIAEEDLVRSPAWVPVDITGGGVSLVRLDEAAYRRSSFLDQRLRVLGYAQQDCPLAVLRAAAARLTAPSHYIFHIGHVGSTLISRLIGERPRFFALREPGLLRNLTAALSGQAPTCAPPGLELLLPLLGRTWRADQRAVIKATSFVSEIAARMLAATEQPAALFVFARARAYLSAILAGANSRAESRQLVPSRLRRLSRLLGEGGWRAQLRSEGEYIAMSWLCEMLSLREAAVGFDSEVLWVDFDAFLRETPHAMQSILRALGDSPAEQEIEALLDSPIMRQYSKAPEHPYDAALRREVLESAEREHAAEIRRGMHWLRNSALRYPDIEALVG